MKLSRMLVVFGALVLLLGMGTAALAQPTYPPTSVAPTSIVPKSDVAPNVEQPGGVLGEAEGQGVEAQGVGALAFTGAELTLLLGAFGILLAGGAAALIAARRRGRTQHA